MWQSIVCGVVLTGVVYYLYKSFQTKKVSKEVPPVDVLKNTLLSLALSRLRRKHFTDFDMNYAAYDGSKLPMMSGGTLNHALMTYIQSQDTLKKGPFATQVMVDKGLAIEKYLAREFDSIDKVDAFLTEFVTHMAPQEVQQPQQVNTETEEECEVVQDTQDFVSEASSGVRQRTSQTSPDKE